MNYWFTKCIKITFFVALAALVFGFVVMSLWNWLLPDLIGASRINFLQALGLLVLSKILFGGFNKFGGGHKKEHWKHRMKEKYGRMTPEEKEKFRMKFQNYCKHNRPPFEEYDREEQNSNKENL